MDSKIVNVCDVALGLATICQEKLTATVNQLVEKGEMGRQQATEFLEATQNKGADSRQSIGKLVQDGARKVLGEIGFVSTDEIAKLRKEIKELKTLIKSA